MSQQEPSPMWYMRKMNEHRRTPIHVSKVKITGNEVTKSDLIEHYVRHVRNATNFEEALAALNYSTMQLQSLGIFKSVNITLDVDEEEVKLRKNQPTSCKVNVELKEGKRFTASASTNYGIDQNEQGVRFEAKAGVKNLFGRNETFLGTISSNTSRINDIQFDFFKPLYRLGPQKLLNLQVFALDHNLINTSSYRLMAKGFNGRLQWDKHELIYESAWRDLEPDRKASFSVRQFAGHSLKSSIKHIYSFDKRDDIATPTRGHSATFTQELAGIGGNVRFYSQQLNTQFNVPLPYGWAINFCTRGGFMFPFGGDKVRVNDRFQLGGPLSLRGFKVKGVGPRAKGDALGGELFFLNTTHITSPPLLSAVDFPLELRTHLFHSFGNIVSTSNGTIGSNLKELVNSENIRATLGCGLILKTVAGRIEFNYTNAIRTAASDLPARWAIGVSYKLE